MRILLSTTILLSLSGGTMALAQHWPHWRGPSHDGVSTETGLPVSWGAECTPSASGPDVGARGPAVRAAPEAPAPAPQGRGGGRGEGRPMTSMACKDFQTKNMAWKLPMPAYSGSTPIIWGNTIFLNVATGTNTGELELWAVDKIKQVGCRGSGRSPPATTCSASRTCRRRRRSPTASTSG